MGKRRVGRYPRAFRQMAVDRLRKCGNVVALSEELGVHRRLLYKWRKQSDPAEADGTLSPNTREFTLTREICHLKRLLAEKVSGPNCIGRGSVVLRGSEIFSVSRNSLSDSGLPLLSQMIGKNKSFVGRYRM